MPRCASPIRQAATRLAAAIALALTLAPSPLAAQSFHSGQAHDVHHRHQHRQVFDGPHHLDHPGGHFGVGLSAFRSGGITGRFETGHSVASLPRYYNLSRPGPFVIQGTTGYFPAVEGDTNLPAPRPRPQPPPTLPRVGERTPTPRDAGGWAFLTEGRYAEARGRFELAVERGLADVKAKLGRIVAGAAIGELDRAAEQLTQLLKTDDALMLATIRLTTPERARVGAIVKRIETDTDKEPKPAIKRLEAALYYVIGDWQKAKTALEAIPDDAKTESSAADTLKQLMQQAPATQPRESTP